MTAMGNHLEISEKHRTMVETLLQEHFPDTEVWAYGSRVNGRSHDGSDLDLVLRNTDSRPLPAARMQVIVEAFRESNIPFLVDIHDWSALPDRFRAEIERDHVVMIAGTR